MTSPLSPDIAEGRRLLDAATPGPWTVFASVPNDGVECYWLEQPQRANGHPGSVGSIDGPQNAENEANAKLVAWSRNNLPALLDRLEAAEARVRELEAAQPRIARAAVERIKEKLWRRSGRAPADMLLWLDECFSSPTEIAAIVAAGTEAQP